MNLLRYTPTTTTRSEVLRAFVQAIGEPVAALVYTPPWCGFVRIDANGNMTSPDASANVANAYEVRAFHADAELRWRSKPGVGERCVVLCEKELSLPWQATAIPVIETLPNTYLLWGQETTPPQPQDGWCCLAEARIGAFWVPTPHFAKRLRLQTVEYVAQHESGNAYIIDERLCGFTHEEHDDA